MTHYLLTKRLIVSVAVIVSGFAALVGIAMKLLGAAPEGHDLLRFTAGWLIIPYCFGVFVGLASLIVFSTGRRAAWVFGPAALALLVVLIFLGFDASQLPTIAEDASVSSILTAALTIILFIPALSATIASVAAALWQSLNSKTETCGTCGRSLNRTTEAFCPVCGAALPAD